MIKAANVGTADRIFRIVLGAILIALPYLTAWSIWASPAARWGLPIVGAVLITTALVRFCPLYRVIGANTCSTSS